MNLRLISAIAERPGGASYFGRQMLGTLTFNCSNCKKNFDYVYFEGNHYASVCFRRAEKLRSSVLRNRRVYELSLLEQDPVWLEAKECEERERVLL
jgi:hypothetical protein